jgi:ferredoxin-type protein NapF
VARLVSRILVLVIAAVFALQILPDWQRLVAESAHAEAWYARAFAKLPLRSAAVLLPAMSPFLALCSLGARIPVRPLLLLCVPVLGLSLLWSRWFCRNMCPTGLLAEYAGKIRGRAARGKFRSLPCLGPALVLFAVGGAVLGYPVFLWLDPLSVFNGFAGIWTGPLTLPALLPGTGMVVILLLSLWRPNAWCYRLCPLGFTQELLGTVGRYARRRTRGTQTESGNTPPSRGRRLVLAGLLGAAAAFAARRLGRSHIPIRPPGSAPEVTFGALCVRCGNCVRACPEHILQHDLGESGIPGLLSPVVAMDPGYCQEFCNECTKVCPTGAITAMSLKQKQSVSIGTAEVTRSRCLAWEKGQYCMVCDEYCPYHAVKTVKHNYINCPEVDPEICRGCGLCQTQCPAEPAKAIIVHGRPQKRLKPVEI